MNSAAGKAKTHDATQAPGQSFSAVRLNPAAMNVEMPDTIKVMKKVRIAGTTMRP